MVTRLPVAKTHKLFIAGKFPRSESGRSTAIQDRQGRTIAHVCRASRKDLRDAVTAATGAFPKWSGATAYLRGQILYRMGEMLEGKAEEFTSLLAETMPGGRAVARKEVDAAVDRLIAYAGWTDKYAQVLGCQNPVAGPYYNFTVPQPTGVVAAVAPDEHPLLAMVALIAPVLCAGGTVIAMPSSTHPIAGSVFGEVCATSDVPAGVVNILTGDRAELIPHVASHRGINGIHAVGMTDDETTALRTAMGDSLKRVMVHHGVDLYDPEVCTSPWWIEPFVEMKTIWHPSAV